MPEANETGGALPAEVADALRAHGIAATDEAALREALEARIAGYTLVKMMPAAARRWKARYRILIGDAYHDAQSAPEAYARALLSMLTPPSPVAADAPAPPAPDARAPR